MNTNTLQPEYAEIAEWFLLAWDSGKYDSIPTETFILELVEKCQAAALKRDAEISALKAELEAAKEDKERLNYLESEDSNDSRKSLFRQNMPITREAIDAAMQSGATDSQEAT